MSYCSNCGKELTPGAAFCAGCGSAANGTGAPGLAVQPTPGGATAARTAPLLIVVVVIAVIGGLVWWQMRPSPDRQRVEAVATFAKAVVDRDTSTVMKYVPEDIAENISSEQLSNLLNDTELTASEDGREWLGDTLEVRGTIYDDGDEHHGTLTLAAAGPDVVRITALNPGYDSTDYYIRLSRESGRWKVIGHSYGIIPPDESDWVSAWDDLEGDQ